MQNVNKDGVEMMTFGSCATKPKHKYMQNLQEDWRSTDTGMGKFFTMMVSILITSKEYNTSYQEMILCKIL
jgi:hypothetical protein